MSGKLANAEVSVRCSACGHRDTRPWTSGPQFACRICESPAVAEKAPKRSAPASTGKPAPRSGPRRLETTNNALRRSQVLQTVRRFLTDAGLDVRDDGDQLRYAGKPLRVPTSRGNTSAEDTIDELVGMGFTEQLVASAKRHLRRSPDLAVERPRGSISIVIRRSDEPVAVLRATQAVIVHTKRVVRGNFLTTGEHWAQLHAQLAPTGHAAPAPPAPAAHPSLRDSESRILYDLPETISGELRDVALAASHRIRHERSLAFGHLVQLTSTRGFVIAFSPVHTGHGRPEIDVTYTGVPQLVGT